MYLKSQRVVAPPVVDGPIAVTLDDINKPRLRLLERYDPQEETDPMLDHHDDRTINARVDDVLTALRQNLQEHQEIVAEARKGYVKKCEAALEKARDTLAARLRTLSQGGEANMTSIHFNLTPPEDHTKEFETVIKMLELHKAAHEDVGDGIVDGPAIIKMKAIDVQRFVLNEWGWMDSFLRNNAPYSRKSTLLAQEKGLMR